MVINIRQIDWADKGRYRLSGFLGSDIFFCRWVYIFKDHGPLGIANWLLRDDDFVPVRGTHY